MVNTPDFQKINGKEKKLKAADNALENGQLNVAFGL